MEQFRPGDRLESEARRDNRLRYHRVSYRGGEYRYSMTTRDILFQVIPFRVVVHFLRSVSTSRFLPPTYHRRVAPIDRSTYLPVATLLFPDTLSR